MTEQARALDAHRYGNVVLHRNHDTGEIAVESAAPVALLALALLAEGDRSGIRMVDPDRVLIGTGGPVEYRVVGWEPYRLALVIERIR